MGLFLSLSSFVGAVTGLVSREQKVLLGQRTNQVVEFLDMTWKVNF